MNMISTGSFLTETGASNKQSELVKKLTTAWEKKNAKAARAGGVSLMALSLAACGSEDDTPFSAADVSAAEAAAAAAATTAAEAAAATAQAAAVAAAEAAKDLIIEARDATIATLTTAKEAAEASLASLQTTYDALVASNAELQTSYDALANPVAASITLTTSGENVSTQLTTANDTITAANGTLNAGDVIADPSSTDNDSMVITHSGATLASTGVISNVENITINAASTSTFTITSASGITGGNVTVNLTTPGGASQATISDIGSSTTVTAGDRVATLIVDTTADRSDITVVGGTGATTVNGNGSKLTTANIDASAGTTVDVEFGANSSDITVTAGSGNIDLNQGDAVKVTGLTLNGATGNDTAVELGANSSNINIVSGKGDLDINNGATVKVTGLVVDASAIALNAAGTADENVDIGLGVGSDLTLTVSSAAADIDIDGDAVSETTDAGITVTVTADAADISNGITDIDTVNLILNGTSSTVTLDDEVSVFSASATAATQTLDITAIDNLGSAGGTLSGDYAITMTATTNNMDEEVLSSDGAATHVLNLSTAQTTDVDLSGVDADIRIELGAAMNAVAGGARYFQLGNGQTIGAEVAQTNNISFTSTSAISGVTLDLTDAANTGDFIFTNVGTVTVTAEAANTTATTITVDSDTAGTQGAILISGSKNMVLHGDTDASSVTSSGFTGNLTATLSATVDTITSGSGDDSFTAYNGDFTVDGGAGDDTLTTGAVDFSDDTISISNIEVIALGTNAATFLNGQLSGSETVTGTTGDLTITGAATDDTINLSGFTNGLTQGTNVTGGFLKASGAAGADTITGSSSNDVLVGGAGADTITAGNGTDYVTGGTGADVIDLTEATANSAADYLIISSVLDGSADGVAGGSFTGYDVVTGFLSGTDKVIGDTNNAYTTTTVGTALFSGGAVTVIASTGATLAASDLTGTTALDVDSVVAFLADGTVSTAVGYTANEKHLLAITDATGDQTFLYALESADTTFVADEINLLAVIDDVVVAGDLVIA
jgi:hypothetical protein